MDGFYTENEFIRIRANQVHERPIVIIVNRFTLTHIPVAIE